MTMTEDSALPIKRRKRKHLTPPRIIALGFLALIFVGAFLLCLPISSNSFTWTSYLDSLFTAASAVCVTGLIVFPTAIQFSIFGQVVIILLIQIGGLGVMTLTTLMLLILKRKITLKDRLVMQEALNQDNMRGIVRLARNIMFLTFIIEAIGAIIFIPIFTIKNGTIGIWQAVFTSISAFCNAGFDIFGTLGNEFVGLTGFVNNPVINITIAFLIILGGLGFTVIIDLVKNKFNFKKISLHTKIVFFATISLIIIGTFAFFFMEFANTLTMGNLPWHTKLLASFFQSVTCRTAGFNTIDQNFLTAPSKLFSMILMFIGASPGSTGGGIKTTTFTILIFILIAGIKKRDEIIINKHSITQKVAFKAISTALLSLLIVTALSMFLMISERSTIPTELYSLENIMFEAFSAFGTVGVSTGITPFLSAAGKIAVSLVMFLGRVGPITIGLMFMIKRNSENIKYPEGYIMIG